MRKRAARGLEKGFPTAHRFESHLSKNDREAKADAGGVDINSQARAAE